MNKYICRRFQPTSEPVRILFLKVGFGQSSLRTELLVGQLLTFLVLVGVLDSTFEVLGVEFIVVVFQEFAALCAEGSMLLNPHVQNCLLDDECSIAQSHAYLVGWCLKALPFNSLIASSNLGKPGIFNSPALASANTFCAMRLAQNMVSRPLCATEPTAHFLPEC